MKLKRLPRIITVIFSISCAGCVSGLPMPADNVWGWVSDHQINPSANTEDKLKARVQAELSSRLPMTVREFEEMLAAQNFDCEWAGPYKTGAGVINTRECVYFQRGPISDNACFAGEDVAISIKFSYPNIDGISSVTSFDTRVIMGEDVHANSSGICFPL